MSTLSPARLLVAAAALLCATPARAADVDFEGFYRARGRAFDSLSIDSELEGDEGTSAWIEHRFWLRPRFLINDHVGVFAEVRALDNLVWGNEPRTYSDPVSGTDFPVAFTEDVGAPQGEGAGVDITLWRAWGEVHQGDHRFRVGRMPVNWGLGIWQNDGLGTDAEFGDTVDRLQWEGLFDQVYASLAIDVNAEGLLNAADNSMSYNALAAYRTEAFVVGLNLQFRHTNDPEDSDGGLDLFTVDGAMDAELGQIELHVEGVGRFGSGDVSEALNDARIAQAGAVLDAAVYTDALDIGLRLGIATGDGNLSDTRLRTFTFDRDYQLGIVLFEHALPTLADDSADGRDLSQALTGEGVSNSLFLAPRASRHLVADLHAHAEVVLARVARVPQTIDFEGRRYYGTEIDLGLSWKGLEHLEVQGTGAVFFPGGYFTNNADPAVDGTVIGGQLTTRIRF